MKWVNFWEKHRVFENSKSNTRLPKMRAQNVVDHSGIAHSHVNDGNDGNVSKFPQYRLTDAFAEFLTLWSLMDRPMPTALFALHTLFATFGVSYSCNVRLLIGIIYHSIHLWYRCHYALQTAVFSLHLAHACKPKVGVVLAFYPKSCYVCMA